VLVRVVLLATVLCLLALGIAVIYAIGHPAEPSPAAQTQELAGYWKKQLLFAAVGICAFLAANMVNYRRLGALSYWLYACVLFLLVLLLFSRYIIPLPFVPEINGTHRWISVRIGGLRLPNLQPSEICSPGIFGTAATTEISSLSWDPLFSPCCQCCLSCSNPTSVPCC